MFFWWCNWNKRLLRAARMGRLDEICLSLDRGANINAKDKNGDTALHLAVGMGFRRIAERLIERGAQVNVFNNEGHTPLHMVGGIDFEVLMELLIANGAYVSAGVEDAKATPLHNAAFNGLIGMVRRLLGEGAEINARDGNHLTPLHWAAMQGHENIAALLIARGAEPDAEDRRGATPLFLASLHGHADLAEMLLNAGANPNIATTDDGSTPLHTATHHGHLDVAKLLVARGARLDARDHGALKPIEIAWEEARMDLYQFLKREQDQKKKHIPKAQANTGNKG